jgi:hypothetical protein
VVPSRGQTTNNYSSDYDEVISPYKGGWSIVGSDGITETGITTAAAYGCADSQIPPRPRALIALCLQDGIRCSIRAAPCDIKLVL